MTVVMVPFGVLLLWSIVSLGRDGRALPVHGLLTALCIGVGARGPVALAAIPVALFLALAAWFGLNRFAPQERMWRPAVMPAIVALVLVMGVIAATRLSGGPVLSIGVVLTGLVGVATSRTPLSQFVGLMMALDGVMVLAALHGTWPEWGAAVLLWMALATVGLLVLPRLAWLRADA